MLLVYTHKTTPRLNFTFKHFFTRILQLEVNFTTKVEKFIAHKGAKLTYAKQPLGKEIFIRSTDLLFEQGINDVTINVGEWQGVPCFFMSRQEATIPFDIFAATFYLLSRYEEYLPHVKDDYERFPAEESLAFKHGFLERPIIDIWAYMFRAILVERFSDFKPKSRQFSAVSSIDVDVAYCYRHKGVVRTIGGFLLDLFNLRLGEIWRRSVVILGFKKDPFDTYDLLIELQHKYKIPTLFFFLVSEYTTFDKNTSSRNAKYRSLIKSVADYCKVGLHPSYFTMKNEQKLKKEKKRLEEITNRQIKASRQHFLRVALPETYQNLVNLEVTEDYSMSYAKHYGFRASTCTPFYFYDLDYEIQTPLKVFPVAVMDGTLRNYQELSHKRAFETIMRLAREVQHVEGTFITLFHNETLSNRGIWRRWKKVYVDMFKQLSQHS